MQRERTMGPVAATAVFLVVLGAGALAFGASELSSVFGGVLSGRSNAPVTAPAGRGDFVFFATQPGRPDQPVAYSPCDPVVVLVNEDQAPDGTQGMVARGVDEVARLTGLSMSVAGSTDELPASDGSRDVDEPVLVAWTDPDQVPELEGEVAGLGGSTSVELPALNRAWLRTGQVALDAPDLAEILERPDGEAQVYAVVLHELGHLVGLDHTDDPTQLMHSENVGVSGFQAGDRRGLAALGQGRCG